MNELIIKDFKSLSKEEQKKLLQIMENVKGGEIKKNDLHT